MKHARKLASLLLALVMVFALATTAFATGTVTTPTTGTITVDNPQNGTTYTAYKIFDVVYDTNGANGHYSYTIKGTSEWFETVKAYADGANSGLTLTEVLGTTTYVVTTTSDFSAPPFAEALKAAVNGKTGGITLTEDNGKATATDLDLGYYFVSSNTGALCNLTTTNPTVIIHDKNDMPFEKEVDKTNVDVGQIVTFTITGKVPDYTGFTKYTYKITDKMTDGLTFNNDVKVMVGSEDKTNDCTIAYDATNAPQTFTVSIPVLTKEYTFGAKIEVTYTATVNENAIAVISTNQAKLTYSNDPTTGATKDSQIEEQKVYTSKIVIDKYEKGATGTKLEGAEFVLCRKAPNDEPQYAAVQYAAARNDIQNAIQYYKWDETTKTVSWVENIADATKVTTDAHGVASFDGLANGDYWLVETKAPAGYNQMTTAQKVEVKGGTTADQLSVTAKVENQAGTLLPSTGGMGTTVFYVLGAVLVLGAVVLLVTKKRMSDANR